MIVRILSAGKSFKGLSEYLTHDADQAETAKRVAWTHTHNLANDHVGAAVNEMYLTAENAEFLKMEAGIRGGGRTTENPVKHISLNWAPTDDPSQQHMIETSTSFLEHMGWNEHQAVLVAHDDKSYRHVHIMLNVVNPETGLRLDDGFERRRAQAWALQYELEQDRVHCEERLKAARDRQDGMPRNIWMAFKDSEREFARVEQQIADGNSKNSENQEIPADIPAAFRSTRRELVRLPRQIPEIRVAGEWKILKEFQKNERVAFFADGKAQFSELRNSIYREVRGEFRDRWANYYEQRRTGADDIDLAAIRAGILMDQNEALAPRRDEACKQLRTSRDIEYRNLLGDQRDLRTELKSRQQAGLDNGEFLQRLSEPKSIDIGLQSSFRKAADEVANSHAKERVVAEEAAAETRSAREEDDEPASTMPAQSGRSHLGRRVVAAPASILGALLFQVVTMGSETQERQQDSRDDAFELAAEATARQQNEKERVELEEETSRRQRSRE